MSKSTGNVIPINTTPQDMYGKVMSLPDFAMPLYFKLISRYTPGQIAAVEQALSDGTRHPRDIKMELAREIVGIYCGDEHVTEAEEQFKRVFQRGDAPEAMPVLEYSDSPLLVDFLAQHGLAASKSEARRLIQQNGVRLDGQTVTDLNARLEAAEAVLQVGKRKFARVRRL
jgi:tyrosyl-tRNA synthetase